MNGVPVTPEHRQYLDMIQVPFWRGTGPYQASRYAWILGEGISGDFVYHCHILGHEDAGMMAMIPYFRDNPPEEEGDEPTGCAALHSSGAGANFIGGARPLMRREPAARISRMPQVMPRPVSMEVTSTWPWIARLLMAATYRGSRCSAQRRIYRQAGACA